MDELSPYELKRLQTMEDNARMLAKLTEGKLGSNTMLASTSRERLDIKAKIGPI
jgi:hypothetical protein